MTGADHGPYGLARLVDIADVAIPGAGRDAREVIGSSKLLKIFVAHWFCFATFTHSKT